MPCSSQITSQMLSEVHTMEKCYFLIPVIHLQIILFSIISELQIRRGIEDNAKKSLFLKENIHVCCHPSLEPSRRDSSIDE